MLEPMMTRTGINYERRAILEWILRGNTECPMTRNALSLPKLLPNSALQDKIIKWCWENCLMIPSVEKFDDAILFGNFPNEITMPRWKRKLSQGNQILRFVLPSSRRDV